MEETLGTALSVHEHLAPVIPLLRTQLAFSSTNALTPAADSSAADTAPPAPDPTMTAS